jgi:hypothetical protein
MKFKVGDKVRCKPGFNNIYGNDKYGGAGYEEGREFIICSITYNEIIWDGNGSHGIYKHALELVDDNINYEIY